MVNTVTNPAPEVMNRLARVTAGRGLSSLADTLGLLGSFVASELHGMELELATVPHREQLVGQSARHLLSLGGKRIRPLCVALSGRMGRPEPHAIRKLAGAAELVHSATLLHDDVVDQGDYRRGQPTARCLYGNAASVFAGDWLLVEALKRVRQSNVPHVLDRLLDVIDEMIQAEAVQLECRGRIVADEKTYFKVIEGKTAALFRWAMFAGATAAGLEPKNCEALEHYGNHLGIAFQIVDDALDIDGAQHETGKTLFADLREGKMTYPLIVGMARDPSITQMLAEVLVQEEDVPSSFGAELLNALRNVAAMEAAHEKAREHALRGAQCLAHLPDGPAKTALEAVASVAVARRS